MLKHRLLTLAIGLSIAAGQGMTQEPDLRGVIQKAVTAHGGADALKKHQAFICKFKGTVELLGQKRDIRGDIFWQNPAKFKIVSALTIDNRTLDFVHVHDGKKFWISELGKTNEIKDENLLKQSRDTLGINRLGQLVTYLDKEFELSTLGDSKIKDQEAIGIRVSKKGQPDISLFLHKKSHLLLKAEMRVVDAATAQEYTQEQFFSDYKDVNGVKTPSRFVFQKDGQPFIDLEFSEMQHLEKLEDSQFAMP